MAIRAYLDDDVRTVREGIEGQWNISISFWIEFSFEPIQHAIDYLAVVQVDGSYGYPQAIENVDFTTLTAQGTLIVAWWESTASLSLPFEIYDDDIEEGTEAFQVSISLTGAVFNDGTAEKTVVFNILDNEPLLPTDGPDALIGTLNDDFINGFGGDDWISGRAGMDTLIGGSGADFLDGGEGPDFLFGGEGDDTYMVDDRFDLVDEGFFFPSLGFGGFDTIVSTADWYWDVYSAAERIMVSQPAREPADTETHVGQGATIIGSMWSNEVFGNYFDNVLFRRGGSDTYRAYDGVDFISLSTLGLTDENAYAGVDGANTIIVDQRLYGWPFAPFSYDIIFEFESGKDKVDVSDFHYTSLDEVMARGVDDGAGNSYFALGDGLDYVYFIGLTTAQLAASDFII